MSVLWYSKQRSFHCSVNTERLTAEALIPRIEFRRIASPWVFHLTAGLCVPCILPALFVLSLKPGIRPAHWLIRGSG